MSTTNPKPSASRIAPNPLLVTDGICQAVQGKVRDDVTFSGNIYRAAGLCAVSGTEATIASRDGQADVPLENLPPALRAEADGWLAAVR